jgi:hypothetical protein
VLHDVSSVMITEIRPIADSVILAWNTDVLHMLSSTESGILTRICYEEYGMKLAKFGQDLCYEESQIQKMGSHVGNAGHGRFCYCKLRFCASI